MTSEYGGVVAAATMCHMFGIPLSDAEMVRDAVLVCDPSVQDVAAQGVAYGQLTDLVTDVVRHRRAAGADGRYPLVDGLLDFRLDGRALTDEEISGSVLATILFGGAETLPKVVAHGLMELWRDPDQRRAGGGRSGELRHGVRGDVAVLRAGAVVHEAGQEAHRRCREESSASATASFRS